MEKTYTSTEVGVLWELHRTSSEHLHLTSSPFNFNNSDTPEWVQLRTFLDSLNLYSGKQVGADSDDVVDTTTLLKFFGNFNGGTLFDLASSYRKAEVYPDSFKLNKLTKPKPHMWMFNQTDGEKFLKEPIPVKVAEALSDMDNLFTNIVLHTLVNVPVWVAEKPFQGDTNPTLTPLALRNKDTPSYLVKLAEMWLRNLNRKQRKKLLANQEHLDTVKALTANIHCSAQTLMWLVDSATVYVENDTIRFNTYTHPNLPSEVRLQVWLEAVRKYEEGNKVEALNMAANDCLPTTTLMGFLTETLPGEAFIPAQLRNPKMGIEQNDNKEINHEPFIFSSEDNQLWGEHIDDYVWLSHIVENCGLSRENLNDLYNRTIELNNGYDYPEYLITYSLLSNPKTSTKVAVEFLKTLPYLEDSTDVWGHSNLEKLTGLAEKRLKML